ncbi:centrosomin isoform X4 [Drosophila serrata]|uniref:centrosomin isoform X4 n=1 Tax=Drosophila serrata TaxID=7274 RepID=UPI000A1D335D|nr:centrosomin isoform X4 [Drosophila serrata]
MDQSKQAVRDYCGDANGTCASSLREITLIETVTSFLEEHGASEIDRKVLRKLAEALSKSIDDTTPGTFQDVTMENSYASFDVARPPGGSQSPMLVQGRSVRELEEQISSLRKENFNLKLRIYFMEENQSGARGNHSVDTLNKQLIDSKIEVEMLRKTVDEKMELLKDAARAISHHEEKQRKADLDSQTIIDGLQEQIRAYQFTSSNQSGDYIDFQKLKRLEMEVQRLEEELLETNKRNAETQNELEFALAERSESLTACEAKIEELAIKNAEMVELLEANTESSDAANKKLAVLKAKMKHSQAEEERLMGVVDAAEMELVRKNGSLKQAFEKIEVQRQDIQLLESSIKQKEETCSSLLDSVLRFEQLVTKQNTELDIMRKENHLFNDNLQSREQVLRMDRVAVVQPVHSRSAGIDITNGVGNKASIDRSGSSSSLHSNFSSISILCGNREPTSSPRMYLPQLSNCRPQVCRSPAATFLTVAAPSTAFYNYSVPSQIGFRQFLCPWGAYYSH